jgi:phosphonoacetate hydrolase
MIDMRKTWTRRGLMQASLTIGASTLVTAPRIARAVDEPQRAIIIMCDGFGLEYYDRNPMPTLKAWAGRGIHTRARAVMPSVTNTNNASICCGVWPAEHGVIGNSYFDPASGTEEYMEDAKLLLAPTIFERARTRGVRSALLSSET